MKNNKEQKAEPAAGGGAAGIAERSRYMQENKKSNNVARLIWRRPGFFRISSVERLLP
jgi:hypothetical protein